MSITDARKIERYKIGEEIMRIKSVAVITPVYNEPADLIRKLVETVERKKPLLRQNNVGLNHFFLDDGARDFPDEFLRKRLVCHEQNQGLAKTLIDGYQAITKIALSHDLVIKMDCQEHDPDKIFDIISFFSSTDIQALFLPVYYWVKGQPKPSMNEILNEIGIFSDSLCPIRKDKVLEIYNQKFPLGYQAFSLSALKAILPRFEKGYRLFEENYGKPSWGFDLLSIILAAQFCGDIEFIFGGWMTPWEENRPLKKIEEQAKRAAMIIDIAKKLGCKIA